MGSGERLWQANLVLGQARYFASQYDGAVEQLRTTLELEQSYWYARFHLGLALQQQGKTRAALAQLRKANSMAGAIPDTLAALGYVLAASEDRPGAQRALEQLMARANHSYVSPYRIAEIYAGLNDAAAALT